MLSFLLGRLDASAQPAGPIPPEYIKAVDTAFTYLQTGQCQFCLEVYARAFALSRHSPLSHFRAARCAQMCGDTAKARFYAGEAVRISWGTAGQVLRSHDFPELDSLRYSDLGKTTLARIETAAVEAGFNFKLSEELNMLREQDQKFRRSNDEYRSKYVQDSPEYQQFLSDWRRSDSLCLLRVEAIIQQFGYPGKTLVGGEMQDVAWLIIQHAPLEKQERYFPLIEAAVQKDELQKSCWAMLLDRIRMYRGQPQVYGSQVVRDEATGGWKFHEIEDESNVNKRRAEVGLGLLEEYAKRMGVDWKPK